MAGWGDAGLNPRSMQTNSLCGARNCFYMRLVNASFMINPVKHAMVLMSSRGLSGSLDEQLRYAISRRNLIRLRYSDAVRVVEPHDYGIKNGSAMLLAYQLRTSGPSEKSAIGWRLFDVAKIAECFVLEKPFKGSRGAPDQQHHAWDTLYARVE